jgi:hypothetical protein
MKNKSHFELNCIYLYMKNLHKLMMIHQLQGAKFESDSKLQGVL